jgi:hypothetical protein
MIWIGNLKLYLLSQEKRVTDKGVRYMTGESMSTVIGVFPDYDQANNAIDELRHTRFSYDRIRLVQHGTGNFFDNLKGMFTGQAEMTSNTVDVLMKMGMPDYEARHYQQELDAHHVLLLMNADDRPEEAFSIMRQNGAFDINSRLRTAPSEGVAEIVQHAKGQELSETPTNVKKPDTPPVVSSSDVQPPASKPVMSSNRFSSDVSQEKTRNQ